MARQIKPKHILVTLTNIRNHVSDCSNFSVNKRDKAADEISDDSF